MKRVALLLLIALCGCKRITSDTGPAPSASVAVKLVDLPKASSADEFVHAIFVVDVNADGTYAVNGLPVGEAELRKRASEERGKYPELRAVIRADGSVPYQRVITVMDLLKQGGISQMGFAVSILPMEIRR